MTRKPTEAERANAWRQLRDLTVVQLAELTGYSIEAIYQFERGVQHNGQPIQEWVWLRYKRACQGVQAEIAGAKWPW